MPDEIESIWPPSPTGRLTDDDLATIYTYPSPGKLWVRANFVASLDGAATINGRTGPLSGPADTRVFRMLRALADVILVGAGTVRTEGYGDTHHDIAQHASLRRAQHLAPVPPIAVVTRFANLDPASALFTNNIVPPIVLTSRAAPKQRLASLAAAGAEVVLTGDQDVSLTPILEEFANRGFRRVLCEGGPQLLASLLAAEVVDELCLTVTPTLVGGHAPRIACGTALNPPANMRLKSVLFGDDALLLCYRRRRVPPT